MKRWLEFAVLWGLLCCILFLWRNLGDANAQIEELQDDVKMLGEMQDEKEAMLSPGRASDTLTACNKLLKGAPQSFVNFGLQWYHYRSIEAILAGLS